MILIGAALKGEREPKTIEHLLVMPMQPAEIEESQTKYIVRLGAGRMRIPFERARFVARIRQHQIQNRGEII
jgi:hypothetical protein